MTEMVLLKENKMKNKNYVIYSSDITSYPKEYLDELREFIAESLSIDESAVTQDDLDRYNYENGGTVIDEIDLGDDAIYIAYGEFNTWNRSFKVGRVSDDLSSIMEIITPNSIYDYIISVSDGELNFQTLYHDGRSKITIRVLTAKGKKYFDRNKDESSGYRLAEHLMSVKGYTKKWKWR